ncbi:MAG: hypothetical protein HQK97_12210 [Nitrospirae bacterium]|nr:hypothetical protein [Nitrospirota bacterium]
MKLNSGQVKGDDTRVKMVGKRVLKKHPLIQKEIEPPLFYGSENPEIVVTGWGSTYGIIKEAVTELGGKHKIAMLHFSEIYPFPLTEKLDYLKILSGARATICVENNATGQFSYLMHAETGYKFSHNINHYDGRPFLLDGLIGEINDCVK